MIFPSSAGGTGTIGRELDAVQDALVEAYMDAILGSMSSEDMLAQLNTLPGAEILMSAVGSLKCNIPPLIDPPLGDWFKGLELDFCRGTKGLARPKLNFEFSFPDFWKTIMAALKETLIHLFTTALLKIFAWLIEMILNLACKLIGMAGAALTGDFRDAYRASFCGSEVTDEELDVAAASLFEALGGCDAGSLQTTATGFITDLSLILTSQELIDLFNGEATDHTLAAIVEIGSMLYPDTFGACEGFSSKDGVEAVFLAAGSVVPPEYRVPPTTVDEGRPIHSSLCDPEAIAERDAIRCSIHSENRKMTPEQCEELMDQLRNRNKQSIADLANLAQNGLPPLPPLLSPDPCSPGLFPTVDPIMSSAASESTKGILDSLSNSHRQDLVNNQLNSFTWGSGGIINMIMSSKRGDGFSRHLDKIQDSDHENKFPDKIATHMVDAMTHESFIIYNTNNTRTTLTQGIDSPIWGADYPREFVSDEFHFDEFITKMGHQSTALSEYAENPDNIVPDSPPYQVEQKQADITLKFNDYYRPDGDKLDFEMEYSDFEIVDNRSVMNDYYRIKIINKPIIEGFDVIETASGFRGEGRTESGVKELVDIVATSGSLDLDIDEYLDGRKSPRHSLYAKFIMEKMKQMCPHASGQVDDNSENIFDAYYEHCDTVKNKYFKLISQRIVDDSNDAFSHGFPTSYQYDEGEDDFVTTELGNPGVIKLDQTYINPKTGESQPITPEDYGGTAENPAYYVPTPVYGGWTRIMEAFAPGDTACEPNGRAAVNFSELSEYYDNLFNTLVDDERLFQNPKCAIEAPWDKILDRPSTCGVEMMLKSIIRIHAAECMITGMPSFLLFDASSSTLFDDSILDFIVDKIEAGLLEHEPWFGMQNEYYFTFMSQAVHTFGRMKSRGDIKEEDLTSPELEAIEALNEFQSKWETEVAPKLAAKAYPGMQAAGIMTAVGSIWGAEATGAASILASFTVLKKLKETKENYWLNYVANADNLRHSRVLLRRLVRDELKVVAAAASKDLEPKFDGMHNLFLNNSDFMIGALSVSGPNHVATLSDDGTKLVHNSLLSSQVGVDSAEIPYMLEKYIKITNYEEGDDSQHETYASLTRDEKELINREREEFKHLNGVVNLNDWADYLSREDVKEICGEDREVKDLWAAWEFGVRVVQVTGKHAASSSIGWVPSDVQLTHQLKHKAFNVTLNDSSQATLIPVASTEKESPGNTEGTPIADLAPLNNIYDAEIDCLIADLVKTPEYEMVFDYCISLSRILSILTIYVMYSFTASIGSSDDWPDFPGGRKFWLSGNARFYGWDKRNHFRRSKRMARDFFLTYYNATDLGWKPPKAERPKWGGISWSLFWWLRSLERKSVFDADGNPC